jgi:acyl carrier protein
VASVRVTENDVAAAVSEILAGIGVEPDLISGSAILGKELELDSTDAVEVGLELKRRFSVAVKVQVKGGETVDTLVGQVLAELAR